MRTEDAKKRHLSITSMTLMLLTVTLAVTIITITTSDNAFARGIRAKVRVKQHQLTMTV
jgi:hypothetical protein